MSIDSARIGRRDVDAYVSSSMFHFALRSLTVFLVLAIQPIIGASTDTLFLDKNWNRTSPDSAALYFLTPGNPSAVPQMLSIGSREIPRFQFSYPFQNGSDLVGRKVDIWKLDDWHADLGSSYELDWPSESIRAQVVSIRESDRAVKPGDTATIVWVFQRFRETSPANGRIYLLRTSNGIFAFGGESMTMPGFVPKPAPEANEKPTPTFAAVHGGVLYQGGLGGEVSVAIGKFGANHDGYAFWGASVGGEFRSEGKPQLKLSVFGGGLLLSSRLSLLGSSYGDRVHLSLVPEIGLNLVLLELTYGYELGLLHSDSRSARHRFNVGFSFPFYYSGP